MPIIDGKKLARSVEKSVQKTIEKKQLSLGLSFFLVGDHPPSKTYVAMKKKACERVGIRSKLFHFPKDISEEALIEEMEKENKNSHTHAILVQLPLPPQISSFAIMSAIHPDKDVDGFHPINMGKTLLGEDGIRPCTPLGICKLLETLPTSFAKKNALIIGRSNIVGKPLATMLLRKSSLTPSSVTVAHSRTQNLKELTSKADLLIVAAGSPHLVKQDMVKKGAIVIDVGVSKLPDKKNIVGDVDFAKVHQIASYITPVPGGVGPMTVSMLLHNTLLCKERLFS